MFRPQRETVLIVTDPADPGLQHRFVGLLSTAAQRASVRDIPGFGDEIAADLHLTGTMVHSHYGRAARTTLESLPRDLVLELSAAEVADLVAEIVGLQERRLVRVFEVPEPVGLWTTVLVYFPRSRFTAELPAQLADTVAAAYGAEQRTFESFVGASSLARVTVSVRRPTAAAAADLEALERAIDLQTTSWNDRLRTAATVELGDREGRRLFERFAASSSPAYRAAVAPERAVADLRRVGEMVDDGAGLATSLDHDPEAVAAEWRFRVYRRGTPMMLSELLPLLDHLGFTALDEQPYSFSVDEGSPDTADGAASDEVHLYDIGVRVPDGVVLDDARAADIREAFAGLVEGVVESDGFNRLVLLAGLDAREVAMLRAYAKYLRQIGFAFSQPYIEATLAKHAGLARNLAELFAARFDPSRPADGRDARGRPALSATIGEALDAIPSLDEDRICRSFLTLITATVRTNYYRDRPTLAFKLDPAAVPELPLPRPVHEIWVCGPRVEGVHLRGGPIARGGIRWSDRREDFRTEVLGLMKAQMVKNAVIVPTGAKGGFVVKQPAADPDANRHEVVACYQTFIRSLLDVTDNLVAGAAVPPARHRHPRRRRHLPRRGRRQGNGHVQRRRQRHLGRVRLLARRRVRVGRQRRLRPQGDGHHRPRGVGERAPPRPRPRARRRHRPAHRRRHRRHVGRRVRQRDAALARAAAGRRVRPPPRVRRSRPRCRGGLRRASAPVRPAPFVAGPTTTRRCSRRAAACTRGRRSRSSSAPQARAALGVGPGPLTTDRADLGGPAGAGRPAVERRHRHLREGVDRDPTPTSATAPTTRVRVDGAELRCRMVGEGGNLGFTQLGRVEYALAGGLIYTDAIDNSAGVDCSDHEVNIKILLDGRGGGRRADDRASATTCWRR